MKRYGKHINIEDTAVVERCIYACLRNKWRRREVRALLSGCCVMSKEEVDLYVEADRGKFAEGIARLARDVSRRIRERDVRLPPIRYKEITDRHSRKIRRIGTESIIHQIYDYIAVEGIKDLCHAKIAHHQWACLPGRGQVKGMRAVKKWLNTDEKGTKYAIKCDVRKCYPSISHDRLMAFLRRDIKNDALLWLLELLINQYDEGLSIGSYLSQYLCNYYLSYAYHYAAERLAITRERRGQTKRVRIVNHVLFYMDDILLLGGNKRHLRKGFELLRQYMKDVLLLDIKDDWRLFRVQYIAKDGRIKGGVIDMMGYKVSRVNVTVRRSIFRRIRREIFKARRYLKQGRNIPLRLARCIASLYGWLANSNSYGFICRHRRVFRAANRVISNFNKKGVLALC